MDSIATILDGLGLIREDLGNFYRDLHRNPELSMQETRTAAVAAERVRASGYEVVERVGKTGVVAMLENGDGPTVMLRADMDALPVREQTGLAYASTATGVDPDGIDVPVMHACGHDMHVTCLAGAAHLMATSRDRWRGRLMLVFQPAEETGEGAHAMIDDGLFSRFGKPSVVLGQHVIPAPAGMFMWRAGTAMAAADSFEVRLYGRGGHGSQPQSSIDPVVMAAAVVMRLQTIVAREVAANEPVVVTVGSIRAGTKENIIPDEAFLKLNVRSYSEKVHKRVVDAIHRIVDAEASASGAPRPPDYRMLNKFPLLRNDPEAAGKISIALASQFGAESVRETQPVAASEDFGEFGVAAGVPSMFWTLGCMDPNFIRAAEQEGRLAEIPSNHSPLFAPVVEPTLSTGVQALVTGAMAWLPAR